MTTPITTWHGKPLPYTWAVLSDVGRCRQQNEDAFALEPEEGLFLVTDGMGGHPGGKLASQIIAQDLLPAIETKLANTQSRQPRVMRKLLKQLIAEQSRQLCLEGNIGDGYVDMGATLVLAMLIQDRAYFVNLGDSRAYRLRNRHLRQLSKDHSVVAELLDAGDITPVEAQDHKDLGLITRYVGMEDRAHCHVCSVAVHPGDRFLLCTDGLTDMLSISQLKTILETQTDCHTCCQTLINEANNAGGHDNITALILDWQGKQ